MCNLRRVTPEATYVDTVWIPLKFAVKGKFLKIKRPNGEWWNGWEVMDGFCEGMQPREISFLNDRSQAHKKMRRASDMKKGNHAEMCD